MLIYCFQFVDVFVSYMARDEMDCSKHAKHDAYSSSMQNGNESNYSFHYSRSAYLVLSNCGPLITSYPIIVSMLKLCNKPFHWRVVHGFARTWSHAWGMVIMSMEGKIFTFRKCSRWSDGEDVEYYEKTASSDAFILSMCKLLASVVCCLSHHAILFSAPSEVEDALFHEVLARGTPR